jgi:glycosyltransferase involved in cell wall biosynthesis
LGLSIPLILGQFRKPEQLIIVDASDDHEHVKRVVVEVAGDTSVELKIVYTKVNLSHQRNVGLEYVKSPVVMFPDDDSLWWPGFAEAIMHIYERDINGDIGGVCGRETIQPPPDVNIAVGNVYKMTISDRIRQKIGKLRHKFDYRFCPDPLWLYGRSRWNVHPLPKWFEEEDIALVEMMTGFRMTFRTEIIRECGFDEDFCIHTGYSAYGDIMPSFHVLQTRLLVGAHRALVYHYRYPGERTSGFKFGFFTQLNRAYLVCRYSPPGSAARKALKRFAIYKAMQYALGVHSKYERDRVRGVLMALRFMGELLKAPPNQLRECYLESCQKAMLQRHAKR